MKKKIAVMIFLLALFVLLPVFFGSDHGVSFADEIRDANQLVDIGRNERESAKVIGLVIVTFVLGFIIGKVSS